MEVFLNSVNAKIGIFQRNVSDDWFMLERIYFYRIFWKWYWKEAKLLYKQKSIMQINFHLKPQTHSPDVWKQVQFLLRLR